MLPLRKILCPIDFSEFSTQALSTAAELATHFEAELYVLHVVQVIDTSYALAPFPGTVTWDTTSYHQAARDGAIQELREVIVKQGLPGERMHAIVREGSPADVIVEVADAEGVDLLVIPTHGKSGWRHLLLGSVAERVVRLANRPVLVTHPEREAAE